MLKGKNGFNENSLYVLLKNTNITDIITGGVQAKINQTNLNSIPILYPSKNILFKYNKVLKHVFDSFINKNDENKVLVKLLDLLLSKLATIEN